MQFYWDLAKQIIEIIGALATLVVVVTTIYAVHLSFTGFVPVLFRLGNGLRRRKIAIFAKGNAFESLEALFDDSKLFSTGNIIRISTGGDFGRAENASVFLVYWPDWQPHEMVQIIERKHDRNSLIVYAPQGEGCIPQEIISLLEVHRNVVLANLRGRLLNDVVISLITTAYEKR